ncbi:hypothetical protein Sango_1779300 [Sesamum angolense]|uniref:Uncharacterized protein n=1 Tax=Sesamum angolense TaxID=2727404 RepID=A0AAE1WGT7_9LAMI|nr:hypothetical protein Sango_1779300 [Sesamum angolense]
MQGREKRYQKSTGWLNHGGNIYNRRYAAAETKISPSTAPNLHLKWEFKAGKDISATPDMRWRCLFPQLEWIHICSENSGWLPCMEKECAGAYRLNPSVPITNVTGTVSRATPTIAEDKLIVPIYGPAYVVVLKRKQANLFG